MASKSSSSGTVTSGESSPPLSDVARSSLAKWLEMVVQQDFEDLPSIVAADARFHSPVSRGTYPGRALVCLMLRTAAGIFEAFAYHRVFVNGDSAALEFSAHVGDIELKGVHLIRFNAAGELVDIEKLVRGIDGAKALGNAMGAKIGPQIKALREAYETAHGAVSPT